MKRFSFFLTLSIAILAANLAFQSCQKTSDLQSITAQDHTNGVNPNDNPPNVVAVVDRVDSDCCCNLVVSSTYFDGLTICGVAQGDGTNYCDRFCTTSCGMGSGFSQYFPEPKNGVFCINTGSPFRITNNGVNPIQIYFICGGSPSAPVWIAGGASVIYANDCSGTTIPCTETSCGQ